MAVKTTQITEVHGEWDNEISQSDIDQLNKDFADMDLPLKVVYEATEDGFTIQFIKIEVD